MAISKPTVSVEWDANQENYVEPDQNHKDDGWLIPGGDPEKPPLETFNHWMNSMYLWKEYFEEKLDTIQEGSTADFVAGTIMLFGAATPPVGWTRKADWVNNSMLVYAATGVLAAGGAFNPKNVHRHTGPNHSHTMGDHTHTGPSHSHSGPNHSHDVAVPRAGWGAEGISISGNLGVTASGSDTRQMDTASRTIGTGNAGTGSTGTSGTGNTGAPNDNNTDSAGTGNTSNSTEPIYQEVIAATKD